VLFGLAVGDNSMSTGGLLGPPRVASAPAAALPPGRC
jgi:hypothetical protein